MDNNIVDMPMPTHHAIVDANVEGQPTVDQIIAETFAKANEGVAPTPENEVPGTYKEVMVGVVVTEKDTGFEFRLQVFAKEKPTHECAQMALQIQNIVGQAIGNAVQQHKEAMASVSNQQELPLEGQPLGKEVPMESYLECDPDTGVKDVSENQ